MSTHSHTAIITGASRGIGFSIAKAFARDGIRLMIVGRDPVRLAEAQSTLAKEGFSAEVFSADVSLDTGVRALQQAALAKFDRVDILVNSAGSAVSSPFLKTDLQSWNSMIESHLTSTYR